MFGVTVLTWPTCHGSTCFAALAQKKLQQLLDCPVFDLRKVENYSIKSRETSLSFRIQIISQVLNGENQSLIAERLR